MFRLPGAMLAAVVTLLAAWVPPAFAHDLIPFENVAVFRTTENDSGRARQVIYLRPATQPAGSLAPAIVLLHYLDGDPADMADLTQAGRLARDDGAWIILPEGVGGTWNYKPDALSRVDDVAFLAQLIRRSVAQYPIDPKRIYMAGYSDGGLMTQRFACDDPQLVAAAASVAATLYRALADACTPATGTPMLFLEGEKDDVLPYGGNLLFLSAPATAAFWANVDGCTEPPQGSDLPAPVDDGTQVHLDRYTGCAAGTVELDSVLGGGHTWPGAYDYSPDLGLTTRNLDADAAMWQFFSRFERP